MKRTIAGFALSLALSASAAVADGMDKKGGASCCASTWTGFYLGAGAGGGVITHTSNAAFVTFDGSAEGFLGTAIVGFDYQLNSRVVVGLFVDYDFASTLSRDFTLFATTSTLEHQHTWSVGGRAGILLNPTTLWYGTAGYSQYAFDYDFSTGASFEFDDVKAWFVGLGVESQLGRGWSLRGEYRYTQFDEDPLTTLGGATHDLENAHTARLLLSYKFGRREEAHPLK
jgi:outer membrane immunogenic protein